MPMACAVLITRAAISPRLAMSSLLIMAVTASHPEDAETAAAGDRAGVHGRQGQAQDGAGVARVDDAVVVQPRGDEEGVRLGLDLSLDRGRAGPVRLLVERPPGGGGARPADYGQHAGQLSRAHHGELGAGPGEYEPRVEGAAGHAVVA